MRTAAIALAALVLAAAAAEAAPTVRGVPLPRRSRALGDSGLHFASSRGFRKTVVHFRRHFARRGIAVTEVPVYSYRGVIVARFIAKRPTSWLAVHIFRDGGRTQIYVVPAPTPPPAPAPPGNS